MRKFTPDEKKLWSTGAVLHNPVIVEAVGLAPVLAVAVSVKAGILLSVMTAVTPMSMPSMVRNERTRLASMFCSDMRTHSPSITSRERNRLRIAHIASLREHAVHNAHHPARAGRDAHVVGDHNDRIPFFVQ